MRCSHVCSVMVLIILGVASVVFIVETLIISRCQFGKKSPLNATTQEITCSDVFHESLFGKLTYCLSSSTVQIKVDLYLSTNEHREPKELHFDDADSLRQSGLNTSASTVIVIHGYRSGGLKSWVKDIKDRLLDKNYYNIILVDYSSNSYDVLYVELALNLVKISQQIYKSLEALKPACEASANSTESSNRAWNRLYFIGHSLGAHISGQVARALRHDKFWKLDRITGLDPAKPCFVEAHDSLILNKGDADFVDIIHTQIGKRNSPWGSLGMRNPIGDLDFYVNGGVKQPSCNDLICRSLGGFKKKISSHQLAYKYFLDTLNITKSCRYNSYEWEGTYKEAKVIINQINKNKTEPVGIEMGFDASKVYNKTKMFLVVTGPNPPYCKFDYESLQFTLNMTKKIIDPINGDSHSYSESENIEDEDVSFEKIKKERSIHNSTK